MLCGFYKIYKSNISLAAARLYDRHTVFLPATGGKRRMVLQRKITDPAFNYANFFFQILTRFKVGFSIYG